MFYLQQDLLSQHPGEEGPCPLGSMPFLAGVFVNDRAGAALDHLSQAVLIVQHQ